MAAFYVEPSREVCVQGKTLSWSLPGVPATTPARAAILGPAPAEAEAQSKASGHEARRIVVEPAHPDLNPISDTMVI